jgi:hypothetical protein
VTGTVLALAFLLILPLGIPLTLEAGVLFIVVAVMWAIMKVMMWITGGTKEVLCRIAQGARSLCSSLLAKVDLWGRMSGYAGRERAQEGEKARMLVSACGGSRSLTVWRCDKSVCGLHPLWGWFNHALCCFALVLFDQVSMGGSEGTNMYPKRSRHHHHHHHHRNHHYSSTITSHTATTTAATTPHYQHHSSIGVVIL